MITPTGNHRNPYSFSRQHNNKHSSFADMFTKSAAARTNGTQVQQSAATTTQKEDAIEFGQVAEFVANGSAPVIIRWTATAEPSYPKSVYDLSDSEIAVAFDNAKAAASQIDSEGKTKTEIYNEVKSVYESYLGKDFKEPATLFNFRDNSDDHIALMNRAVFDFSGSLDRYGIDMGNRETRKEVNGYGGMSDDEIRAAIEAKYPSNTTLRDCLNMSIELTSFGLDNSPGNEPYSSAFRTNIMATLGGWSNATRKVYDAMLDLPADYDTMKTYYADLVKNNYNTYPMNDMDGVTKRLLSITGGNASDYSGIYNMLTGMQQRGELKFNQYGFLWA